MHVIINGVSSETLQGVQVLSLPPITKPRMRTSVAVIDGRPGDIVTHLGYEAYNRKIRILLHHDYDIDAISAFFNTSGTIIFSNEPDMEYEFETIDAFSFERAVQYKTADITFHVQPYKLSATEEPATGEVSTLVDRTPYIIRRTPFGTRQKGTIVGGSIVFNQIINDNAVVANGGTKTWDATNKEYKITATNLSAPYFGYYSSTHIAPGHVAFISEYLNPSAALPQVQFGIASTPLHTIALSAGVYTNITAVVKNETTSGKSVINYHNLSTLGLSELTIKVKNLFAIDLTLMFGSTIADYIYTQEQATAGAGVALAKAWAGITADYYPYDAGSIKSVTGLTAHRMTDGNSEVIGEYPLDSSLTLRGLPKIDGGSLYYDGDVYPSSGEVERKYRYMEVTSCNYTGTTGTGGKYAEIPIAGSDAFLSATQAISNGYQITAAVPTDDGKYARFYGAHLYLYDGRFTDKATADSILAEEKPQILYALAEPTTETAEPYTALQICDPNGTEEWVGASMPVGHETTYIDPISMTVNNEGNTTSAPSITIEGEGTVEVTVDGLNILQIQMPASGEITIDSKTLDATDGEGGLANRSVTGDYNDLRLTPGEHTVTVIGDVTSVTLKNTSRWI